MKVSSRGSVGAQQPSSESFVHQILLIGFPGSGRTSFLVRLCADEFLPVNATGTALEVSPVFDYEKLNARIAHFQLSLY